MPSWRRVATQLTSLLKAPAPSNATQTPRAHELESILSTTARRLGVPGAAAAVVRGGERATAATGVLNTRTRTPASPDSLFLIGSITKLWTTTMVMQLVDEGEIELDDLVRAHLPELRLATADATDTLTIRHLLTHTAGLEDDFGIAAGDRGDGCIRRYVARIADFGQLHPAGAMFSYCNSGYVLAGRLLEHMEGETFDDIVRARLIARLGLEHTVLLPEEAMLHPVAVGHVPVGAS